MQNATILALQGPNGRDADLAPLIDAAIANNGRLSVLHVGPVPLLPAYSVGAAPYAVPYMPDDWVTKRNAMIEKMAEKQTQTRELLKKQGLTGEVATLCVEPTGLHTQIGVRAIFADLSVVLNSLREETTAFENTVYGLLFEAPGPVILNSEKKAKALAPENVLIAWNSSLPAARAVRGALPLLRSAKEVTVACIDPDPKKWADGESPGADLASWLSHHGCRVTVQEYASGGKKTSAAIMDRAAETGADLVVMGAYGRSRLNERIFGGTTRSMMEQEKMPVLMAH
ncbi:universal stress protein [Yoonia sediminilitoris]|uniref:Universal stress protein family protein n=1 Tax=Yoonia sediminilitoris TaxID=1286148 RepID=A0A2T6KIR2_9RHOB|nr:universal stress protein [Yoonia sediminilitoris]PUB15609.1 universal stress protein family protein [Yoonia sediminilitoris]RCW96218.1 universal stress protein family protein [Yoonia sediminilitoris]